MIDGLIQNYWATYELAEFVYLIVEPVVM